MHEQKLDEAWRRTQLLNYWQLYELLLILWYLCTSARVTCLYLHSSLLAESLLSSSRHLQRSWRDAVTFSPGAEAVPLFHGGAVRIEHPSPVFGFRGACGVLADHNSSNEVITAFHIVAID